MTWNYRILFRRGALDDLWFAIHEVYYDEDGNPGYWSEEPAVALSETTKGIADDLLLMAQALERPILVVADDNTLHEYTPDTPAEAA